MHPLTSCDVVSAACRLVCHSLIIVVAAVHSAEVALASRVPLPSFAPVVAAVHSAEVALASRVPLPSFAPIVDAVHSADVALPFFSASRVSRPIRELLPTVVPNRRHYLSLPAENVSLSVAQTDGWQT